MVTPKPISICISKIGDKYVVSPAVSSKQEIKVFDDLGVASGYDSLLYFIKKHFDGQITH